MSSQPISLGGSGAPIQFTGLASGLNTNAIIQALLRSDQLAIVNLENEQTGLQARNTQLSGIQGSLQTLSLNAQALGSPGLFAYSQTVTSTDPTLVSAAATSSSGVGAVTGGYQVNVTQLATASQRTFSFTSPSAADAITIDGQSINLAAGASIQDLVNSINSDSTATVYAAATTSGTVVLSDRATGAPPGGTFIQVSDPGGVLTEQTALAQAGQDAQYTVNGVAGSSSSNTVTGAIAGVTLTLNGATANAVTVNVGAPAPSASNIEAAVKTFVDSYNSALDQIDGQLTQKTVPGDPTQGTLFGDLDLSALVSNLREGVTAPGAGLPAGAASLLDIGISTGTTTGSNTPSQSAIEGHLTIDSTKLANAIQSNPTGVKQILQGFAQSFSTLVNAESQAGGDLALRIQFGSSDISDIGTKITTLQSALQTRQQALQQQFAQLEQLLSHNQTLSNALANQIASLPHP